MTQVRPIISCRNVSKIYRMGDQEVRALDGVDIDIHEGEFVAIMGPSGSGKSSLMNLIGALDRPTSGEMWISGRALSEMTSDELADLRNETLGFVFQQFNLLARQDALQNVRLPLRYARKDVGDIDARAKECLELVGLGTRMDVFEPAGPDYYPDAAGFAGRFVARLGCTGGSFVGLCRHRPAWGGFFQGCAQRVCGCRLNGLSKHGGWASATTCLTARATA